MSWYRFAPVEMIQSTKPALDQRNERRHAEPRRRQRAGERHADGDVGLEHLAREELAGFAQPRRVVREERVVDQVGGCLGAGDRLRIDSFAAKELLRSCDVCRSPARSRSSAARF